MDETREAAIVPADEEMALAAPDSAGEALRKLVREETQDGRLLVQFFMEVLNNPKHPMKHRIEAAKWLADRGFGRVRDEEPTFVALKIDIGDFHVPGVPRE